MKKAELISLIEANIQIEGITEEVALVIEGIIEKPIKPKKKKVDWKQSIALRWIINDEKHELCVEDKEGHLTYVKTYSRTETAIRHFFEL